MNVRMTGYAEQYIEEDEECSDDGLFWLTNVTSVAYLKFRCITAIQQEYA
jgi:hypothetical protein